MLGNPNQKVSGVAVAGVADTDHGKMYREQKNLTEPRDAYTMAVKAAKEAIEDAGLSKEDIDGVVLVRDLPSYEQFCYKLGVRMPRFVNTLEAAGRQSGLSIQYGAMAILTGMAETVLIVYSNNGKSVGDTYGGAQGASPPFAYGRVHGFVSPGSFVGAMFNRYCYEFKQNREDLGMLAMSNRYHASMNPKAVMRDILTPEKYKEGRYVSEPLRLYDYCLINDGAIAIILTSLEKAKTLRKPVVEITASTCRGDMTSIYSKEDFFYTAQQKMAAELYQSAKISQEDVDCLQIYDNFTPTILFGLEGFGFCERGKAFDYLKQNGSRVGESKRPINTSGSHTSESYMQGFNLHVECVRQLRGECGERQIKNCEIAQYIIPAPILTSHIFVRR